MFSTLIPNAGLRVLQKGIVEGLIYQQISDIYKWRNSAGHVPLTLLYMYVLNNKCF